MSLILSFGNILNGGNVTKGQADGFKIDALNKLTAIKDINKNSALDYICLIYLKKYP